MEDAYLSVGLFVRSYDKAGGEQLELVKSAILIAAQWSYLLENASLMQEALDACRESLATATEAEAETRSTEFGVDADDQ